MIRSIPLPARRLLTVPEDSPLWEHLELLVGDVQLDGLGDTTVVERLVVDGALVRLHPPADASDGDVAAVVGRVERAGAVRVKVVPRVAAPEVVRRTGAGPSSPRLGHRAAVMAVADESRSSDPEALRALLGGILDEEGI